MSNETMELEITITKRILVDEVDFLIWNAKAKNAANDLEANQLQIVQRVKEEDTEAPDLDTYFRQIREGDLEESVGLDDSRIAPLILNDEDSEVLAELLQREKDRKADEKRSRIGTRSEEYLKHTEQFGASYESEGSQIEPKPKFILG